MLDLGHVGSANGKFQGECNVANLVNRLFASNRGIIKFPERLRSASLGMPLGTTFRDKIGNAYALSRVRVPFLLSSTFGYEGGHLSSAACCTMA